MLSGKADLAKISYPILVSRKLDGIRCLAMDGKPMSRTMKVIRNRFVQKWFDDNAALIEGFDGELIVGNVNAEDVYRVTNSAVMSEDGEPDFRFYIFDLWDQADPFASRLASLQKKHLKLRYSGRTVLVEQREVYSPGELDSFEVTAIAEGYEGVMIRSLNGPYKQGRSSTKEGYLLKMKRYHDAEAKVIGYEEELHNANEATIDALGHTKRSSHQENKIGKNTLGAFICEGLTDFEDIEFKVGTGLTAHERLDFWNRRDELLGKVLKFKYFNVGVKDAPRHPVFLGFRDPIDMDV